VKWKSCELESWNVEQAEELQTDTRSGFYASSRRAPRQFTWEKSEKSKHRPMGDREGGGRSICASRMLLREVRCVGGESRQQDGGADDIGCERRTDVRGTRHGSRRGMDLAVPKLCRSAQKSGRVPDAKHAPQAGFAFGRDGQHTMGDTWEMPGAIDGGARREDPTRQWEK